MNTSRRQFLKAALSTLAVVSCPIAINTPTPKPTVEYMTATEVLLRQEEAIKRLENQIVDPPLIDHIFIDQYQRESGKLLAEVADRTFMRLMEKN